jgi:hypothetical protein
MSLIKNILRSKRILAIGGLVALLIVGLVAYRLIAGRSLNLKSTLKSLADTGMAVVKSGSVKGYSKGDYTNIVFLHHSTGRNLIAQGQVREGFTQAGYTFWDQDYNDLGLRGPDGQSAGFGYWAPNDNTDPDGLATIFSQPSYSLPVNILSGLLQHEVIIVKSCFPNSQITSEERFQTLQSYYRTMRQTMQQHPDKLFVILTSPPLNPAETNAEAAARARRISEWLQSEDFVSGIANIAVFDFYNLLAEDDPAAADFNMLRQGYRDGADSHPNQAANAAIGPQLVTFVVRAIEQLRQMGK